jgi:hypothetical protein
MPVSSNEGFVTALLFSGRKNPSWTLPVALADKVMTFFADAPVAGQDSPVASILGYRGVQYILGDKTWHAFEGRIWFSINEETIIVKTDPDRQFEKSLLEPAPKEIKDAIGKI